MRRLHPTPQLRTGRAFVRLAPIALIAALTACGSSDSDAATAATPTPETTPTNEPTTTEPASTAVPTTRPAPTTTSAATVLTTEEAPASVADLPAEPRVLYEWYPAGDDVKSIIVSDETLAASPVRIVPETDAAAVHSNWSREGTMFAWEVLDDDTGTATVWTANADGSEATERVTCAEEPCVQMSWPSFSTDHTKLLVTRYDLAPNGDWGPSHLVLVDLASGEQTIISSTIDGTTSFYMSTMSPDGSMVAATLETYTDATQGTRSKSEVVVVDTDPATADPAVPITDAALNAGYPSWHPVDDRILFASWDLDAYQGGEESQLYTIASDGSGLVQITDVDYTTTRRRPGEARWTPDGQRIIASIGVVEGGRVVDVKIAYIDPTTGEISETTASGAMPSLQP